jgi:hypothetical protein
MAPIHPTLPLMGETLRARDKGQDDRGPASSSSARSAAVPLYCSCFTVSALVCQNNLTGRRKLAQSPIPRPKGPARGLCSFGGNPLYLARPKPPVHLSPLLFPLLPTLPHSIFNLHRLQSLAPGITLKPPRNSTARLTAQRHCVTGILGPL